MIPDPHLSDLDLSALLDDQLTPEEARAAHSHLGTCAVCSGRVGELRSLLAMLRSLPSLEPPRDFTLGPRLVQQEDPPNLVRLRRWYGVARTSAASLAAAFVFLSAGALYVGSQAQPSSTSEGLSSAPRLAAAPASPTVAVATGAASGGAGLAAQSAPAAPPVPRSTAPADSAPGGAPAPATGAAGAAPVPAAPPAAAGRARLAPTGDATDQVSAATSVRPLPTFVPTPAPLAAENPSPAAPPAAAMATPEAAAPLRGAAEIVGLLAACGLLVTLAVRRRLRTASLSALE